MNKYNSERYYDPTAYEALSAVEKEENDSKPYKLLIYIASPFAGDFESNITQARGYCRFAVSKGRIPIAPHLHYPQFMDDGDKEQRSLGLKFALFLLGKCDELWVFGERISNGMTAEIAKAKRNGMPIRYFNSKCEEVSQ